MVAWCLHTMILSKVVYSANVTSCKFPAVYGFGDFVVDVGNAIAAFPSQFAYAEVNPNGIFWPAHSADRMCDGKLLIDFVCKYLNACGLLRWVTSRMIASCLFCFS